MDENNQYAPAALFISQKHFLYPPGRAGQFVSRRGPPVSYSADHHLGCVSSRQPGAAGAVGTGQTFPGETQ